MSSKKRYIKLFRIIVPILCVMLLLILYKPAPAPAEKEEVNYCNDEESWKEWEDLAIKYPNDEDVIILHALRLGLCGKVKRRDISAQQATDIFEKARIIIIERAQAARKK